MLGQLTSSAFAPFSIAAVILFALAALELITLMFGSPLSGVVDSLVDVDAPDADIASDADHDGFLGGALDWLNLGRVPILAMLMALLASFSAIGILGQTMLAQIWMPLPAVVAVPAGLILALPPTRWATRLMGKLVPRDESYAVEVQDLVGRVGTVTVGPVRAGVVARAKIEDAHGNWHFPRIEPFTPELVIEAEERILIVEARGQTLAVIRAEDRLL